MLFLVQIDPRVGQIFNCYIRGSLRHILELPVLFQSAILNQNAVFSKPLTYALHEGDVAKSCKMYRARRLNTRLRPFGLR